MTRRARRVGRKPGPACSYAEAVVAVTLARAYAVDQAHAYVLAYVSTLTATRFASE